MTSVPKLKLKSNYDIPIIGLGTYRLRGKEFLEKLKTALELGYNHIDTAEMYRNEEEIGEAISKYDRSELFITTKVWKNNLHYRDVLESCEGSLKRLNTSYIDLYLIHWPNESIPIKETLRAMEKLVSENKVRSIGVSNFSIQQVKEASNNTSLPICVNQVEFHPWLYQKKMLDFCQSKNIILTAYTPIARTQVFDEKVIQDLVEKYDRTPAQIILRWEIQKGVVAIPKSGSKKHLKENLQIFDWELEKEDEEKIDNIPTTKEIVNL
ncbi:MAG: aldo/keto reductase [Hadesarchaea archaeon]|nr:aldo/keto reductase [Hadesarchaea archaeon]